MGDAFCIDIDPNKMNEESWDKLNHAMDVLFNDLNKEAEGIAKEFDVSLECALDIQYLRTRSRWTKKAEDELIRMDKEEGKQPNGRRW
jgi:hypothetical protein